MLNQITPVILTYNESPNIGDRLAELRWASDIVVVDSYSEDDTVEIVSNSPQARLFQRRFDNHAAQWNFAIKETGIKRDWVLAIDADYRLPDEFIAELSRLQPRDDTVGYRAHFRYCIRGRAIRSGVYPPVTVLYRTKQGEYVSDGHTQRLFIPGNTEELQTRIFHDDRKSFLAFFEAQRRYAQLESDKIYRSNSRSLSWPDKIRRLRVVSPAAILVYCLIVRGGIWDSWPGLCYASQRALAEFLLSVNLVKRDLRLSRRRDPVRASTGNPSFAAARESDSK